MERVRSFSSLTSQLERLHFACVMFPSEMCACVYELVICVCRSKMLFEGGGYMEEGGGGS